MKEQLGKILPENRVDEFLSIGKERSIKANEYFVKEGETPLKIAYVFKGLFRYVYLNDKGDEFTKGIITENLFISSYSAMILASLHISQLSH
jgi:CRP-like cAMP-binding protein